MLEFGLPPGRESLERPEDAVATWSESYEGEVVVHEEIEIVYERELTKRSKADLALVFLRESLEGKPGYRGHAGAAVPGENEQLEVQPGAAVVLVGVGSNGVDSGPGESRFYGDNNIVSINADGSTFALGQQSVIERTYDGEYPLSERALAAYALSGDSGGTCYHKATGKVVGVIKSAGLDRYGLSVCTNLLPYRKWLRKQLELKALLKP